ncbi:MAG TPA: LptE family protein [Blastocatellia bacterium]|nr:LptE family protein [Blastocatellia bacterium]
MKKSSRIIAYGILLLLTCSFTECYKPVGRGDGLPKHIQTLAIPPFQNPSLRFKVEQRFTSAVVDEVLRRARALKVVSTAEDADAVMLGSIKAFSLRPVGLDDLGRARVFEVAITIGLTVKDQTKNKILFDNQNFVFRGEYEIAGDPKTFFSEEGPAVDRIARDFAKSVMTTILEGF